MVKIDIKCENGYSAREWSKDDGTLAFFIKGPNDAANDQGEIGRFDVRGRYAGKFKTATGSRRRFGLLDGNRIKYAKVTLTTPDGNSVHIGDLDEGVMSVQDRITLGMCINNATSLVCASDASTSAATEDTVKQVYDLADQLYEEYRSRYITE
jgi:hypothetical protein